MNMNSAVKFDSILHRKNIDLSPLRLPSFLGITMGVLMLMAMAAPSAHAAFLETYYDFEDGNFTSDSPGLQPTSIGPVLGSFTFPAGTDLASFSGSYSLDEQMNISMAPIDDKETLRVTSLPTGKQYRSPVTSTVQVQAAQSRLDIQGLETAIRQLQTR